MNMKLSRTLLLPIDLVNKDVLLTSKAKKSLKEVIKNKKRGFTLAEVLITLTILGVVAAITVPNLLSQQNKSANLTKVKKAIATYENVVEQIRVLNGLTSVGETGSTDKTTLVGYASSSNCANGRTYFKISKSKDGNNCIFQANDKVWWNITDMSKPIVSFYKDGDKTDCRETVSTDENNDCYNKSFYFTAKDSDDKKFFVINDPNGDANAALAFVGIAEKKAGLTPEQQRAQYLANTPDSELTPEDIVEKYSTPCEGEVYSSCTAPEPIYYYGFSTITYNSNGQVVGVSGIPVSPPVNLGDVFCRGYDCSKYTSSPISESAVAVVNSDHTISGQFCYAKGTQITLADGSTKNVEDICFEDDLMVWDFDNGCFASAKPLWIKQPEIAEQYNKLVFSNGAILKTINQHRIFNKEAGKYTYPMTDDTPIGTTTLLDDRSEVTLVSKEIVHEPVEYYNIITNYHMNCFASGISTSCRLNNIYPIKDYKFEKDDREIVAYENFHDIPKEWYDGLRLGEQPQDINRDGADKHDKSLNDYVTRLIRQNNESKRLALV